MAGFTISQLSPQILVFNKVDRLTHAEEAALKDRVEALRDIPAVFVSALDPDTYDGLREALKDRMRGRLEEIRVHVPVRDGEALAAIYREGEVISREDNGVGIDLTARVPTALLGRLRVRDGIRVLDVA